MDLKQIFVSNLKKFRKERGISQLRLSLLCDTATSYIGEIEIGRRFPSPAMIQKFAEALGVDPWRFFREDAEYGPSGLEQAITMIMALPDRARLQAIHRISLPEDAAS